MYIKSPTANGKPALSSSRNEQIYRRVAFYFFRQLCLQLIDLFRPLKGKRISTQKEYWRNLIVINTYFQIQKALQMHASTKGYSIRFFGALLDGKLRLKLMANKRVFLKKEIK